MKIAIVSDIHSNLLAFNLALKDIEKEKIDKIIFLGDYVTDGEKENEIVDIIRDKAMYAIAGNREKYLFDFDASRRYYENYKPIFYTYSNLRVENLNYLKSLENHMIISIEGYKVLLIHGDEYGHTQDKIEDLFDEYISKYDFDICLFGHTHHYLKEEYRGKLFLNPGSIGEPTDGPSYKYLVVDFNDDIKTTLKEFPVKDTYSELLKSYQDSDYYYENKIWCDLVLRDIKEGKDYLTPFMRQFLKNIKNDKNIDVATYNQIWHQTYEDYLKKITKDISN